VGVQIVAMGVSAADLAAATASAALLAFSFGAMAVLAGAVSGRRSVAIGLPAALAVAAYLVSSLGSLVDSLEFATKTSPYYHYIASDPLRHGLGLGHVAFLLTLGVLASLAAALAFERRDLAS
jgi:ABC-2 type transport system permease protein